MKPKVVDGLVKVLLDARADFGDRDDAAMYLGTTDSPVAESALARIACDQNNDEFLLDSCGESLAEIWARRGSINADILVVLTPVSLAILLGTLKELSPSSFAIAAKVLESEGLNPNSL